ncbi:hypothetical protein ACF0H5_006550 [Mactra antiquata]
MRKAMLLRGNEIPCNKCNAISVWRRRKGDNMKLGGMYVCPQRHTQTTYINSFFQNVKIDIRDVMLFLKLYLDGMSLKKCAVQVGVDYSKTAVYWGSYIREVAMNRIIYSIATHNHFWRYRNRREHVR